MKKSIIVILVIVLLLTATLSLVGCKQSFNAKSVKAQIDDNLHWHWGGGETCVYDVFDGDELVGTYTSIQRLLNATDVEVTTSIEEQNATLSNFSGYAFISILSASVDGKEYTRITQSYTDEYLSPVLSYVKEVYEQTVEIKTAYANNRINATFIVDGEISEDSVKSKAAMLYDNAYVYQFARATDLASALSITVPTYTVDSERTQVKASTFSTSYSSSSSVLDNEFVIERNFVETDENSGGSSYGIEDDTHKKVESTDDEGNVTTTYSLTVTNIIPTVKVTFASTNSSLVTGYIYCYISSSPMRMKDGDTLSNRVVVMMQEGKMTYKLKSVQRTYKNN
ncbi:MAG: hypothetical protein K2G37_01570 [Clostridia bacterium]|nr:hypothetical protein [Clostridia bacterium]MDE7329144.1 hypothetical protein [Clostridia bacterium]